MTVVQMSDPSEVDTQRTNVPGHVADVVNLGEYQRATLTVPGLAELLNLSVGTTYQYLRRGEIPARRVGRRWVISRRRIESWLEDVQALAPNDGLSATGTEPYPWEVR